MMEEDYNPRIPLKKQVHKPKKGDIIDISSDEVFISMDTPTRKPRDLKKERVKSRKSAKLKRKTCRCK
jgi:hypothetical protein